MLTEYAKLLTLADLKVRLLPGMNRVNRASNAGRI